MDVSRLPILVLASLLTAIPVLSHAARADNQQPSGSSGEDWKKDKNKDWKQRPNDNGGGQQKGFFGEGGQKQKKEKVFEKQNPGGVPAQVDKGQKEPWKKEGQGNKFKTEEKPKAFDKQFGGTGKDNGKPGKPVVINPSPSAKPFPNTAQPKPLPPGLKPTGKTASPSAFGNNFDQLRKQRKEKVEGGNVVIEEPGKRTIFKQNNRLVIQHDETERLRRVAPNARFEKGKNGSTISVIDRPGNVKIYSETDAHGQLIRRYRRGPDGRDVIIIDNRRRRGSVGRSIATGVGIGLGVAAGAAILNSIVDVPEPRVRIPRDQYIVEYEGASDEDVYDALSAPPVDDYSDRYTLDEIRATAHLRDRMRRVDLDDITFEFGSWEVDPSQYRKLERIARAMRRIIDRDPNEVFLIEGYTDAVGSREDNLSLSDRRAESVAEVLSEEFQVPFENLTTQGYGEDYLKVPTDQPERLNRRVAVRRITPLLARDNGPPPPAGGGGSRDDDGPDSYDGPDDSGPPPRDQGRDGDGGYQYSPYRGGDRD